jgi:hypothetical protein
LLAGYTAVCFRIVLPSSKQASQRSDTSEVFECPKVRRLGTVVVVQDSTDGAITPCDLSLAARRHSDHRFDTTDQSHHGRLSASAR